MISENRFARTSTGAVLFALTLALAVLVLSGCASRSAGEMGGESGKATGRAAVESVQAPVMKVEATPIEEFYEAPGTVVARERMQVASKILGRIEELTVVEGSHVKKGQLLFRVDDREARARLDTARAELTEAEGDLEEADRDVEAARFGKTSAEAERALAMQMYNRYSELVGRRSVSQQEFDKVDAKLKSTSALVEQSERIIESRSARRKRASAHIERSRAAVREAEVQLAFAQVVAPASGVVAAKQANVGDVAMPGVPVLTIDSQRYRLEVPVEESRMPLINKGARVTVTIESLGSVGEKPIASAVEEVVPAADPQTRSSVVKLSLPGLPGLRSGIFGRARFTLGKRDAIELAKDSIVNRGQLTMVYIVDPEGIARLRLVKTGKESDGQVEILAGLEAGENVVVGKTAQLKDGVRVQM